VPQAGLEHATVDVIPIENCSSLNKFMSKMAIISCLPMMVLPQIIFRSRTSGDWKTGGFD